MRTFVISAIIFLIAVLGISCQTATKTDATTNSAASTPLPDPTVEPKPPTPAADVATTGSLATPTEAYKTAYELRKKKDVAALKTVMSKDVLEFLTMMGEGEKKSLDDMIKDMVDRPQANKAEVRKEKISGNRAELEYLTETGEWKTMDFEKVEGKWLMTLPKAEKPSEPEL